MKSKPVYVSPCGFATVDVFFAAPLGCLCGECLGPLFGSLCGGLCCNFFQCQRDRFLELFANGHEGVTDHTRPFVPESVRASVCVFVTRVYSYEKYSRRNLPDHEIDCHRRIVEVEDVVSSVGDPDSHRVDS